MTKNDNRFIQTVWEYYRQYGRHNLPWRQTTDPYRIVVSEIMLQQTQVVRVLPKYQAFVRRFANTKQLAEAPLRDVIVLWQGLGYNRRAKLLHDCACMVRDAHAGRWPRTKDGLLQLPGIGPYTAGAILAFAYEEAVPIIETNIRTVYLYHFFSGHTQVSESELLTCISRTLPNRDIRQWYWALMDYGSYLKKEHGNNIKQAKIYQKQSRFVGSDRQVRGAIISHLSVHEQQTVTSICRALSYPVSRIRTQIAALEHEGLVVYENRKYQLPGS